MDTPKAYLDQVSKACNMSVVDGPGLHGLKAWLKVWVMCSYDLETDYLIPIKLFFSSINQEQISKYSWSILTSPFPSHHSFLLSSFIYFLFPSQSSLSALTLLKGFFPSRNHDSIFSRVFDNTTKSRFCYTATSPIM